jgi:hypothetical protein
VSTWNAIDQTSRSSVRDSPSSMKRPPQARLALFGTIVKREDQLILPEIGLAAGRYINCGGATTWA